MPPPGVDANFNTILNTKEESDFQTWKKKHAPNDSGQDYDLRGAFKAGLKPAGPEAGADEGHWPDTFKKPTHETFSDESNYSAYGNPGRWEGSTYHPSKAKPMSHENSVTIQNPHGDGWLVVNSYTMKPVDDMEFSTVDDANAYAEKRSFEFGARMDDSLSKHLDAIKQEGEVFRRANAKPPVGRSPLPAFRAQKEKVTDSAKRAISRHSDAKKGY